MDASKLIKLVKCRYPLWDRKHAYYNDRSVTNGLWEEVAGHLGVHSDSARAKWKGLRDTFRGELKKVNKALIKGQVTGVGSTNWEYFNEMLFVKDQIYSKRRSLECMIKYYMQDGGNGSEEADVVRPEQTEVEPRRAASDSEPESLPLPPPLPDKTSDDDDDYFFLMSLLPQLRSLPTTRNLFIRLKIQELLYNEIVSLQKVNFGCIDG